MPASKSSIPRPKLDALERSVEPERGVYRHRYLLLGTPGQVAIQQVRIEVRYFSRDELLVEYRASYAEFFRLGPTPNEDVHDFDVRRDGWTPRFVRWLLHNHVRRPTWRERYAPSRVEYRKRFELGPAVIEGTAERTRFGFLDHGPSGPSQAELHLTRDGQDPLLVHLRSAFPSSRTGAGSGHFASAQGWSAEETLVHAFETRSGTFDDGGGYSPTRLTTAAPKPCSCAPAG